MVDGGSRGSSGGMVKNVSGGSNGSSRRGGRMVDSWSRRSSGCAGTVRQGSSRSVMMKNRWSVGMVEWEHIYIEGREP